MRLYRLNRGRKLYLARAPFGDFHTHEGTPGKPPTLGNPGPEIWWTFKRTEARAVKSKTVDGIFIEGTLEKE